MINIRCCGIIEHFNWNDDENVEWILRISLENIPKRWNFNIKISSFWNVLNYFYLFLFFIKILRPKTKRGKANSSKLHEWFYF